jgi:hypothetical protein
MRFGGIEMRILLIFPFAIFLTMAILLTAIPCPADDFSKDIKGLVEELSGKMKWDSQPVVVGLGNFFYADSKMSSEFAYHFASEVEKVIMSIPQFTLVNRSRLDEILDEIGFQMTDLADPDTAKTIGKIPGLDAMLAGSYSAWGKKVRITAELIRIEDTAMVVATKLVDDIPDNVAIKPPNYEIQKQRIEEKIQDWAPQEEPVEGLDTGSSVKRREPRSDFRVTIEPERSDIYREGDELKLYVRSDRECYIEVYNISEDGSTQQIFPNQLWLRQHSPDDNFIRAGVRTPIPNDSSFGMIISPPYGVETLKVIASTEPFSTRTRSFYQEKGAFPVIGNIDQSQTQEALKTRMRSAFTQKSPTRGPARIAQSYCTILTQNLNH